MAKQTAEIDIQLTNGNQAGKTMNQLTAESVKLNREIKKLEIGSDEWVSKTAEYKKINSRLKDVKTEVYATDKAQKTLNSSILDMLPFSTQIKGFAGSFGNVNKGIRAATVSTNLFKVALASTGIGLIIIALGTLFTWLSKTQEGMDFVAKAGDAIRATFQVVIDRVLTFAGAMRNLVQGNFGAALEGMKNTFSGIGEEIANDTQEAWKLTGALQDITRAEKQLDLQRAQSRATIEQLKLVAEDQTKSTEERAAAAEKALTMEQELMQKSIKLQEQKVKAIKAQNDLGTSTDEDINRAIDAEIELANLREESTTKQIELNNKLNALNKTNNASTTASVKNNLNEEDKAREALNKKAAESAKKLEDLRVLSIQDGTERKIAALQLAHEREMEAFEGNEDQRIAFAKMKEAQLIEEVGQLREEAEAAQFEKDMERVKERDELEKIEIQNKFSEFLIAEEERDQLVFDQKQAALERRLAMIRAQHGEESLAYQQLNAEILANDREFHDQQIENAKRTAEMKNQIEQNQLAFTRDMFGMGIDLLSADEDARRKNATAIKAFATGQIMADLFREIAGYMASPASTATLGVAGTVKSIAAGIRAGIAVRNVMNQQFAKGGVVHGPSHQDGGIPFTVRGKSGYEMEGGETILAKGVYANPVLRNIASQINEMGGGRRFALGGPIIDRPMAPPADRREMMQQMGGTGTDMTETNGYLKQIATHTEKAANRPVPISLQKVRSGLDLLQDIEEDART